MSRSPKRQLLRRTSIALLLLLSALQRRHGGPWPSSLAAPVTEAELLSTAQQRHVQRVVRRKSKAGEGVGIFGWDSFGMFGVAHRLSVTACAFLFFK